MPEQDWERPVVAFEIRGRDSGRMREFYRELFNWNIADGPLPNIARVQPGIGGPVEGVGGVLLQSNQPAVLIYVQVRDLKASMAKVEQLGGARVMEPVDIPAGPTIAQVRDPDGNLLGLIQQ
jgi:predicted enzyme related to lactoylglutathione lyase